jgi:hypothetical protein
MVDICSHIVFWRNVWQLLFLCDGKLSQYFCIPTSSVYKIRKNMFCAMETHMHFVFLNECCSNFVQIEIRSICNNDTNCRV